jgi:SSS family solute:Na+ symporter
MMSWIDWLIVAIPLAAVAFIACRTQKHVKGVAEFMAGGRLGGRYLVCNARGEMGMAVISMVAMYELFYEAGFTIGWWQMMTIPLGLFIALTGYVYYRYRETRAMTLAQFFEIRYSKSFRLFAGFLGFMSGVVNYGIFPAVSARFFVYFCGLPQDVVILSYAIPTFAIIMIIYLSLALTMTLTGGQLTVMITDCVEGLLALIMFVVIIVALLVIFDWSQIQEAMSNAPPGKSMLNPFDISKAKDFNIWFVLIGVLASIYGVMAWQGGHAFNSCAKNAHEAKMGAILGAWRNVSKGVMVTLLAVCAITFLKHPDFAAQAVRVQDVLNTISDPQIQNQMRMPIAINLMLPIAIKGMLCSVMLFGLLACDSSYLHSWGSIFIQDIVLPLRKKALSPKQHVNFLRWAIVGVALFGFFFSLLFRQTEYILMFFAVTGAIFTGGAGAVIAGGLYWKKGTSAGAWSAMISGSGLAVGGIVLQQCWPTIHPLLMKILPNVSLIADNAAKFPINGQVMLFWAMATALILYFVVSLLTCKKDFNMEKMLHRGQYAIADDKVKIEFEKRWSWSSIIGIDQEFTHSDKVISTSVFGWTMFWWIVFVVITVWNLFSPWPISWWAHYWHYYAIIIPLVLTVITTVWFLWGGIIDLHELYIDLKTYKSDINDDGTVVHSADAEVIPDNYVDFIESEAENSSKPKPFPGKRSNMD